MIYKVGILGDAHKNLAAFRMALSRMKLEGVTDIIITGDLIHFGSKPEELEAMLKEIHVIFRDASEDEHTARERVDRGELDPNILKRIFGVPGNQEHQNGIHPKTSNHLLSKYLQLISDKDTQPGIAWIGGREVRQADGKLQRIGGQKIWVSHFLTFHPGFLKFSKLMQPFYKRWKLWNWTNSPARRLHINGKPPEKLSWSDFTTFFSREWHKPWNPWLTIGPKTPKKPSTLREIKRNEFPTEDVSLLVFGHNHEQVIFTVNYHDGEEMVKRAVVNPGSLASRAGNAKVDKNKYEDQGYGYILYTFNEGEETGKIEFKILEKVDGSLLTFHTDDLAPLGSSGGIVNPCLKITRMLDPKFRAQNKSGSVDDTQPPIPLRPLF